MPEETQPLFDHARNIFADAVAAVSPARFLPPHLPPPPAIGRLVVLAAGKAAGSMAAAAEQHYLDACKFPEARFCGLAVARYGYGLPLRRIDMIEAAHPLPDRAGLEASDKMLALAQSCGPDDLVLMLISGGASANLIAPVEGVSFEDKQALTRALLRGGVPIDAMNIVRKHLSRIKGGRLAKSVYPARLVTLALSDVAGDALDLIGSGPSVPDPSTLADAREILRQYAIEAPGSILAALDNPANESPKPLDPAFANASAQVVARPLDAFNAAKAAASALGYRVIDLGAEIQGEAREIGAEHAKIARDLAQESGPIALLSAGELTVTIKGNGRGGPNQEYALALAIGLAGAKDLVALAADTDGTDGGGGLASDPAGAFIDSETIARAQKAGIDAKQCLENNDSTRFFEAAGGLFAPGPTLTNANDLRIVLRVRPHK
jgi:glycerate 2-kinase